jgi:DnaK suppressor protein
MKSTKKHSSGKPLYKARLKKAKPHPSNTWEILSGPAPRPRLVEIPARWARHYRHLQDLRDQLLLKAGKLAQEATESVATFSMHMADAGTDSFDRDFALSMLSSDQDALCEIQEALRRIETGTYGVCEVTGKPIPKARLEVIPWARFCARAQGQLERQGALKHRQFSALSSMPTGELTEGQQGEDGGAEPREKD